MKKILLKLERFFALRSSESYIKYLRKKGLSIGDGCEIPHPKTVSIDLSRPSLITIGDNVRINKDMTIMSHDYASVVFLRKYNEFINSSGKIQIGNNVYFGRHCTVLRGVTIGDNCIIGYGSLVLKDIPSNSVAAGVPAKVICTLDEYFAKRKEKSRKEAFEYAQSIVEKYHRRPLPCDFFEEFPYFVNGENWQNYPTIPIEKQLRESFDVWKKNHKSDYDSFDDFLNAAGIK